MHIVFIYGNELYVIIYLVYVCIDGVWASSCCVLSCVQQYVLCAKELFYVNIFEVLQKYFGNYA
jgi:hypothetical protein